MEDIESSNERDPSQPEVSERAQRFREELRSFYSLTVDQRLARYQELMFYIHFNMNGNILRALQNTCDSEAQEVFKEHARNAITREYSRDVEGDFESGDDGQTQGETSPYALESPNPLEINRPYGAVGIMHDGRIVGIAAHFTGDGNDDIYAQAIFQKAVTEGLMMAEAYEYFPDDPSWKTRNSVEAEHLTGHRASFESPFSPFEPGGFFSAHNVERAVGIGFSKHAGAATVFLGEGRWMTIGTTGRMGSDKFNREMYGGQPETDEWANAGAFDNMFARAIALSMSGMPIEPPTVLHMPTPTFGSDKVVQHNQ